MTTSHSGHDNDVTQFWRSPDFLSSSASIPMLIGFPGQHPTPIFDLAVAPHMLVAGDRQTGKTAFLRSLVMTGARRHSPGRLRFMIFGRPESGHSLRRLPHLLTPVEAGLGGALSGLCWAVSEMDRRYTRLSEVGVRTLTQYNALLDQRLDVARAQSPSRPLPAIVIVIDGLDEVARRDRQTMELAVTILCQMSRATGIHLVLCTSDFSPDVMTGLLKAHIFTRLCFKCSSAVHSRAILDGNGAERLAVAGEALFLMPTVREPVRVGLPFISDHVIEKAALELAVDGDGFDDEILRHPPQVVSSCTLVGGDPLYEEAARFVVLSGERTVASLQHHFRIGFARAARLFDQLSDAGLL